MGHLFMIALRNLLQHSKRTLLLGGAIAGVSSLLVFLICLTSGIRATMLRSAFAVTTGHLNVGGFYKYAPGLSAPLVADYRGVEAVIEKALPDLDFIAARGRGFGKLVSETGSLQSGISGVDIAHEPGFRRVVEIVQGRLDDLSQKDTLLLFETQARKLGVKVGDTVVVSVLTPRGTNNTIDLRVAAVAKDMGFLSSWNVFTPQASLQRLHQLNGESTGGLLVYVKDRRRVERDMETLRKALAAAGYKIMERSPKPYWMKFDGVNREEWTGQKLDLTSWDDELSYMSWALTAVDGLMYVLTLVLLVIIAVGIMNSMWIAIRERTREIGTLRAIGMQRPRVLAMFVIEAFTLGALGSSAGALIGLAVSGALHAARLPVPELAQLFLMSSTLRFAAEPHRILTGLAVITGCCTLVAAIPAVHAARMRPITAMQHLG